jgi:CRISPR/Cas system CMR-associated protein Cmr5 small subunit
MGALIHAKREHTYQVDTAAFMLTTEQWIPIEGMHELDLINALIEEKRRFVKPLRYDAKSAAAFPNALLLDAGGKPVALHVMSAFMEAKDRDVKEQALKRHAEMQWVWHTARPMPALPSLITSAASHKHP